MNDELSAKEKIINAAIDLFSQKGYFETSVRELAQRAGIRVSSLYTHFVSKEAILDTILEYYQAQVNQVKIPDEMLNSLISRVSPAELLFKGFRKIKESVSPSKMEKIIHILVIEMYRSTKVREFYLQYSNSNRNTVKKLFEKMQEKGLIKNSDPELLSALYNALINSYYQELYLIKADHKDTTELENKIEQQLGLFLNLIKL